jgi:ABC-type oligopeptide transport system substrate-binding subunit/serine/threonine protein kinase
LPPADDEFALAGAARCNVASVTTPEKIGRYAIRGVLGRGGMGIVYDADDGELRVAIKTVLGFKNKFAHAVRREIHALAGLRHPGLVKIVDEGVIAADNGVSAPWYAMEFVDGVTLRSWSRALAVHSERDADERFVDALITSVGIGLEQQRSEVPTVTHAGSRLRPLATPETSASFPGTAETGSAAGARPKGLPIRPEALGDVLAVARRLALALEHLHGKGLVHRDLKPDNVLVRDNARPVIVDFGLVFQSGGAGGKESIDELALLGAGTASYMAPEQIRGDGVDARADLYSLGCILFEAISGRPPFDGPTTLAILNQHLHVDAPSLREHAPWVPEAMNVFIAQLLAKEPRLRPANAALVARAAAQIASSIGAPLAAGDEYARPSTPFLYRPALAGRADVLDALAKRVDALDNAAVDHATVVNRARSEVSASELVTSNARGGLVLVVGPSGIGKTRLAVEAARRAASAGALVLAGEARVRGSRPLAPLQKVLQVVSEHCTRGGVEKTGSLLGKNAKIFAAYEPSLVLVPGFELFPDPEPLPAPEARRRLLESLRATLDSLAEEQPVLLILDDLQWADELTLALLDQIATAPSNAPVLVVATVRSEEGEDIVDSLAERPRASVVRLDRLGRDAVREVVADALGVSAALAPEPLVDLVDARALGVPFWVTEVLHAAALEHVIERDDDGAWHERLERATRLPLGTTEILGLRLRGLSPRERAYADAVAVVGRGGSPAVLREVANLDEPAALEVLQSLRALHVLDVDIDAREEGESESEGIRFAHDKLAEAAYALLDGAQRSKLHARAAAVLARVGPLLGGTAEALAWHHEQAGDAAKSIEQWLIAGDAARALSALKDAERCYERAAALCEKIGDVAALAKTLMKLGLVHAAVFDTTGSQRAYQRAFSLWSELKSAGSTHAATPTALVRVTHQPRSLDPARAYDSDSLFVQAQLFEGLVELDDDGDVLPAAASSWEMSGDGRTYTFFLRDDAKFSDGTPVSAADFELSWKRTLDPRTRSPVAQLLYVVENARAYHEGSITDPNRVGVHARGPRTLEVKLSEPSAYLLHLLSHPATFPIPAKVFFEHGARWTAPGNMTSNGAFMLEERTARQVKLRRNPLYAGRAEGNVAEIHVDAYRNYADCLVGFGEGKLDIVDMLAADASALAEARARFAENVKLLPLYSTQYLALRPDRPPLDDERVRKALACLVDRDALANKIGAGAQIVAKGGFIAPGIGGHSASLSLRFDPERASALLADAGYSSPDKLPLLRWVHTHGLGDTTLVDAVLAGWSAFGVRVDLRVVDWNEFERLSAEDPPHVSIGGWIADYPDADSFTRACFHSVDGAEHIGFRDARFDELCETAARTADARARDELYALADHMLVAEKCVVVPLAYGQDPVLLRSTIRSFPRAGSYLRAMKNVIVDVS